MDRSASQPNPFPNLTDAARADLAVALLCNLTGPDGLTLIFAASAQIDDHANDLCRLEFEKEC